MCTPQRTPKVNNISTYRKTENSLVQSHNLVRVSPNQVMTTLTKSGRPFTVVYVGRSTCPYCQQFMGAFASSLKYTGETVGYIDTDIYRNDPQFVTMAEKLELVSVPFLFRIKNGSLQKVALASGPSVNVALATMDILRSGSENRMAFIKIALEVIGVIGIAVQVIVLILHYQKRQENLEQFTLLYSLMNVLLVALQMTVTSAYGALRDVFTSDVLSYLFWCLLVTSVFLLGVELVLLFKPFKKITDTPVQRD